MVNTSQNWMLLYFYFWKFIISLTLLLTFHLCHGVALSCWIMSAVCAPVCVHRCMCIHGHVCVFMCASSTVGLWECSVLLSHGICPMSPCGDVRTEVRATAPLRGRRFTSCLSGPSWVGSSLELWTVFMISQWFNLSASVCLCLSGYVADAATGGARRFCHCNGGGAQCEGVCGEGLQTCGEDHCVSTHRNVDTQSYFRHNLQKYFGNFTRLYLSWTTHRVTFP